MTIEKIQEAETMMFKPISKLVKVIIFFAIEQREIKYLIIGNTVLDQYTSYNCPSLVTYSSEIDSDYEQALKIFAQLQERANSNKKKKDVEIKLVMQNGLTYAVQISHPIIAMICVKHNYTKRDTLDLLAEKVGLAKNDIDNSFRS